MRSTPIAERRMHFALHLVWSSNGLWGVMQRRRRRYEQAAFRQERQTEDRCDTGADTSWGKAAMKHNKPRTNISMPIARRRHGVFSRDDRSTME
jgi:hypothetical protein